jgi:hypothetical protein
MYIILLSELKVVAVEIAVEKLSVGYARTESATQGIVHIHNPSTGTDLQSSYEAPIIMTEHLGRYETGRTYQHFN